MFNLMVSKQEIQKELKSRYRTLVPLLVFPIIALLVTGLYVGVYTAISGQQTVGIHTGSGGTSFIALLLAPVLLSFNLVGLQFARSPKFYASKPYGHVPGLNDFSDYLDLLLLNIIIGVFTLLWTLLFIIPGIIKQYSYSQAPLIFLDSKHSGHKIGYLEAITRSREVMDGHKFNFFLLDLSFIGWTVAIGIIGMLGINLLGIAMSLSPILMVLAVILSAVVIFITAILAIYVYVYMAWTKASYYAQLTRQDAKYVF